MRRREGKSERWMERGGRGSVLMKSERQGRAENEG